MEKTIQEDMWLMKKSSPDLSYAWHLRTEGPHYLGIIGTGKCHLKWTPL
jgi:hypothetical protein